MPQILIDKELCKSCSLCIKACPKDVISLAEESNMSGYFPAFPEKPSACTGCTLCAVMCPDYCITVEK